MRSIASLVRLPLIDIDRLISNRIEDSDELQTESVLVNLSPGRRMKMVRRRICKLCAFHEQ